MNPGVGRHGITKDYLWLVFSNELQGKLVHWAKEFPYIAKVIGRNRITKKEIQKGVVTRSARERPTNDMYINMVRYMLVQSQHTAGRYKDSTFEREASQRKKVLDTQYKLEQQVLAATDALEEMKVRTSQMVRQSKEQPANAPLKLRAVKAVKETKALSRKVQELKAKEEHLSSLLTRSSHYGSSRVSAKKGSVYFFHYERIKYVTKRQEEGKILLARDRRVADDVTSDIEERRRKYRPLRPIMKQAYLTIGEYRDEDDGPEGVVDEEDGSGSDGSDGSDGSGSDDSGSDDSHGGRHMSFMQFL